MDQQQLAERLLAREGAGGRAGRPGGIVEPADQSRAGEAEISEHLGYNKHDPGERNLNLSLFLRPVAFPIMTPKQLFVRFIRKEWFPTYKIERLIEEHEYYKLAGESKVCTVSIPLRAIELHVATIEFFDTQNQFWKRKERITRAPRYIRALEHRLEYQRTYAQTDDMMDVWMSRPNPLAAQTKDPHSGWK